MSYETRFRLEATRDLPVHETDNRNSRHAFLYTVIPTATKEFMKAGKPWTTGFVNCVMDKMTCLYR